MADEREKRTHVYLLRPAIYEISGCPQCGNPDPDWSEYKQHMWCPNCKIDFVPECAGVFDGPIPVHASEMMGLYFDMIRLEDGVIEGLPDGPTHFRIEDDKLVFIKESVSWETILSPRGLYVSKLLAEAVSGL